VRSVYEEGDNTWVVTDKGLNMIKNDRVVDFPLSSSLKGKKIYSVIRGKESKSFLIGTGKAVFVVKNGELKKILHRGKPFMGYTFFESSNGDIWIPTYSKGILIYRDGKIIKTIDEESGLKTSKIQKILEDSDGNIWLATVGDGLIRLSGDKIDVFREKDGLSSDILLSMMEDREKNLWIGTWNSGVDLFYDGRFKTFTKLNSLKSSLVYSVTEESESGDMIVGFGGKGLSGIKNDKVFPFDISETIGNVASMHQLGDGSMLFGTFGEGLFHFKNGKVKQYKLSSHSIFSIFEDSSGRVWVNTKESGIHLFENGKITNVNKKFGFESCFVHGVAEDREKNVWFATEGCGVARLANEKLTYFTKKDGLINNYVFTLLVDKSNNLWLTTDGGLSLLKNGTFKNIDSENGLYDDSVLAILEDSSGRLWMSSNKGIFYVEKDEVLQFFDGKITTVNSKFFGLDDGLKSLEMIGGAMPSVWKSKDGRLWFASSNGLSVIDPAESDEKSVTMPVYIKSVEVDGKNVDKKKEIVLQPHSKRVVFGFSALSFKNPEKNRFRYKLIGYDRDWVDSGNEPKAVYTNLDKGDYRFKVIAANNRGEWNLEGDEIAIKRLPYFYETTLFRTLITLTLIVLIFLLYKIRVAKLKKRESELLVINNQLESINRLKDEFLANTSHELRTPLNGIIGIAESLIDGAAGKATDNLVYNLNTIIHSGRRLATLVSNILDFSKLKNRDITLNIRSISVKYVVELVFALSRHTTAGKTIKLINEIDDNNLCAKGDEDRITQILHNLIGNAIKFTDHGAVVVSAKKLDNFLEISVSDTGIGIKEEKFEDIFKSFEQIDSTIERNYGGTGLGLAITKQLVELLGGTISISSEYGKGSVFKFTLPVSTLPPDDTTNYQEQISKITAGSEREEYSLKYIEADRSSYTIMVVDDELINQQVLENQLSSQKYNIVKAFNGKDALLFLEKNDTPDLIILDIMMPGLSGYEVCRKIREKYSSIDLPIIMLTAKNQIEDLIEGFSAGANDYIPKPFTKNELLTRLSAHLQISKKIETQKEELEEDIAEKDYEIEELEDGIAEKDSEIEELKIELKDKYASSNLDMKTMKGYLKKIEDFLVKEKPYLNEKFSLRSLSDELSIPIHHISRTINELLECNFHNLLNKYRIDLVISMFKDRESDSLNIIEIAFSAGFSNKSSFNRTFKKLTGKTPTEMRKELGI